MPYRTLKKNSFILAHTVSFSGIFSNIGSWGKSNHIGILGHVNIYHLAILSDTILNDLQTQYCFIFPSTSWCLLVLISSFTETGAQAPSTYKLQNKDLYPELSGLKCALFPSEWCQKVRSHGSTWGPGAWEPFMGCSAQHFGMQTPLSKPLLA